MASLLSSNTAVAQTGAYGDVPDDAFYSTPVAQLAAAGVFAGTECDEGFCPGEPIDRKTMAVWTVRVLDDADPPAVSETRFDDVDAAGFYAPFIERMAELGVTGGCGDGSGFCPDDVVTRAQMAVFLSRSFNLPDGPDPGFTDVPSDAWYAAGVTKLAASEITTGCGDGSTFCPRSNTTRAQMATFLHRAQHREGAEAPVQVPTSGGAAVVASGASFIAEFDTVTVEGPAGALSSAARLSLSETQVGAGRTAEGEELATAPIAMSVTGAEIVEPLTLRVEVDTESLAPIDVVPVWWSSALGAWVPLDAQEVVVADGEVIVRSTFANARPVNGAEEPAVTLFAGPGGLGLTPDLGDSTMVELVTTTVVWGIIVFTGAFVAAGVVAITNEKFRDVASRIFGLRVDEPRCDGSGLPAWVEDLSDSDDQASSPDRARLHTCGERADDELRVKVVNNRNYGIELSAAEGDYPVSVPGGANPANVLELAIKKGAEQLIGDSYLWPLSRSQFLLPPQQSDWSGRWHPTGKTIVADVFRFGLDLLRIALPGTAFTDNARFVDCVVDVIERVAEIIKGLSSLAEIWMGVVGQAANCLDSMKGDTSFIKLGETAREGIGQVSDSFRRPSAVTHLINAGISGIKWGLTVADAIKDAQQDEAWISVDIDPTIDVVVPPPPAPARYSEPFSIVAAGANHTCALNDDGAVYCWGHDSSGQTNAPSGSFEAVSSGSSHSCGVRTDGTIDCWGNNSRGQANPPAGTDFQGVTSGLSHSCALRGDGTVVCWGDNTHGQTETHGGRFIAVSAGGNQSCAVHASGTVVCWGDPAYRLSYRTPTGRFNSVSSGNTHSCGIRTDHTIRCWGDHRADLTGATDEPAGEFTAVSAYGDRTCGLRTNGAIVCWGRRLEGEVEGPFTSVTTGYGHMCATRPDGTVECRGDNLLGQTDVPSRSTESDVVGDSKFSAVSAGFSHTCGLRNDGAIRCWGDNSYGEADAPSGTFSAVSVGISHSCGLRSDGAIRCWGDNSHGQTDAPFGTYTAVSAGPNHTCGILAIAGIIRCWGDNSHRQSDAPFGIYAAVSAGDNVSCGITTSGAVSCWGGAADWSGATTGPYTAVAAGGTNSCALGTGGAITCRLNHGRPIFPGTQPERPAGTFSALSVNESHGCGLRTDRTITCWGSNPYGRTDAPRGTYIAVSAGYQHSCAVRTDGTITCWGRRSDQQQPPETQPQPAETQQQPESSTAGLNPAMDGGGVISAGDGHSCALRDSTITCWGHNAYGQSDAPSGTYSAVSAGGAHSCGLRTDGTITCWGHNVYGQSDAPSGTYSVISAGTTHSCGISTDSILTCWGDNQHGQTDAPSGTYSAVYAAVAHTCGIKTGGAIVCWGENRFFHANTPSGTHSAVSGDEYRSCGLGTDGAITCWGWGHYTYGPIDPPPGPYSAVSVGSRSCGLRTDGTITCWGHNFFGQADAPSGTYSALSAGKVHSCGLRTDGNIVCWGESPLGQTDVPPELSTP